MHKRRQMFPAVYPNSLLDFIIQAKPLGLEPEWLGLQLSTPAKLSFWFLY